MGMNKDITLKIMDQPDHMIDMVIFFVFKLLFKQNKISSKNFVRLKKIH